MITIIRKFVPIRFSKMVLVVRSDLKMNSGKIAVQCSHAAVELYKQSLKSTRTFDLNNWLVLGQPKIILKVNTERELLELHNEAKIKHMNTCLIYDAGKTVVKEGTLTVLGIGPNDEHQIDILTKNLKLL